MTIATGDKNYLIKLTTTTNNNQEELHTKYWHATVRYATLWVITITEYYPA